MKKYFALLFFFIGFSLALTAPLAVLAQTAPPAPAQYDANRVVWHWVAYGKSYDILQYGNLYVLFTDQIYTDTFYTFGSAQYAAGELARASAPTPTPTFDYSIEQPANVVAETIDVNANAITLTLDPTSVNPQAVTLSASIPPNNASYVFTQNGQPQSSCTPTCSLMLGIATNHTTELSTQVTVTGVAQGLTDKTATFWLTVVGTVDVSVAPAITGIGVGANQTFTATVKDEGGTAITHQPTIIWTSSNPAIATVSQAGLVQGVTAGTVNIIASTAVTRGYQKTIPLTVTAAAGGSPTATLTITPPSTNNVVVGGTLQLIATLADPSGNVTAFSNPTTPMFTWMSNVPAVARVSNTGLVTALAGGAAEITASSGSLHSSPITITVTAAGGGVPAAPPAGGQPAGGGRLALIRECNLKRDFPGIAVENNVEKCLKTNNPINETTAGKGWALCCIVNVINNMADIVFNILLALGILIIIAGAYYFLTAGGEPGKVQKGQNYILYGVIGLVIAVLAKAIVALVTSLF